MTRALLLLACLAAHPALAAESPFAGGWKLDLARSEFRGDTLTFADAGGGKLRLTSAGITYVFAADGKRAPMPLGYDVAWRKTGPRTWEIATFARGKQIATDVLELSEDGKTLKDSSHGVRPDGSKFADVATYERTGEGAGLVGKWRSTKVDVTGFRSVRFAQSGADGLTLTLPDFGMESSAKLDGKDYPFTGAMLGPGRTLALTPAGDRKLEFVQKQGGKPVFRGTFSLSEDGKTLTWRQVPEGVDEPMTAVFTRE